MDFQTLNRRELQALCKLNKIPANITNIAMIDALKSLETVVGIEELISSRSEGIDVTSPRVPPTSCRTTTRQKVKNPEVESLHATVSRAGSRGVRRQLTGEVNEVLKTPAYSTRRSTRLTAKKSEAPGVTEREKSQPVKMESFVDEVQELDNPIEEKQDVVVLDQSDESKIENAVHVETTTIESGEVDNSMVKSVEIIEQLEKMDLEDLKPVPEEKPVVIEALNVPVKEQDDVLVLEEQKHSVPIEADYIDENALSFNIETPSDLSMLNNEVSENNVTPHIPDNLIHFNSESPKQPSNLDNHEIADCKNDVGKAQEEGLMAVDEIRQETDESSEDDDFVVEEDDIEYLDEVSDNKENEETMNEKEGDGEGEEKGTIKSLNEQSLRQLKKQLKALTIKNNMDVSCVTDN